MGAIMYFFYWLSPLLLIAWFTIFYLTLGRTTVWQWRLRFSSETVTVTGRVISLQRRIGPYRAGTTGTIQYSTPQGKYTIKDHAGPDLRVGQKYEVRYLPANPKVAIVSDDSNSLVFDTGAVIVVTVILAVIVYAVALSR
ncbi:hypothetical protein GA0074704_2975 [Micromonospora siamensis]|uniref:DUF3592 domain-containing protein n=2 Tax=Micromonospora siamensis TaxID=299152 RepID=A0A1C5I6E7_9ACTN|nr:hypothetical protein GA0074704_2975 [Micromonospora siamensis]